jgi:aconitase A
MFLEEGAPEPEFSDTIELDLASVVPSLAGPKRPQDRINLPDVKAASWPRSAETKSVPVPANGNWAT